MIKEFREFISRGNVMDLAVAVIIGAAFTAIVTSLVDDIIMPIVGVLLGGVDFTTLAIQVGDASIMYGNFIQAIINFLIIAFVIFLMVKALNEASKRVPGMDQEEEEEPEEEPDPEVVLLTEIRDLLKKQANSELP